MDHARFAQARQLFDALVDRPAFERDLRLEQLAARDPGLVDMVRRLLAADADQPPEGPQLRPGQRVGDYEVVELLGTGGMAEVWGVRRCADGQAFALKVLVRAEAKLIDRLKREGGAQARLRHPNLVPVLEVLEVAGVPALRMPRIDGPALGTLLQRTRLPLAEAMGVFEGMLDGVGAIHAGGLVHRDLKPDNVLMDPRGGVLVPRVTDFGLVKAPGTAGGTMIGTVLGTPSYAAPEQLLDAASVDPRADVFSLGVLLVRLLAGHLPFHGDGLRAIRQAQLDPPDLSGVPGRFEAPLRAMLAPDPDGRLASVEAVRAALPRVRSRPLPVRVWRLLGAGA